MDKKRLKRETITAPLIVDYLERGNLESDKLLLILHGYGQNSETIEKSLNDLIELKSDYHIIIPNGPFPIPKVRNENILYRFAWYFFNQFEKEYFIDFTTPKNLIKNLVQKIAPNKEITILGYSQGGYLAPFIGECLESVQTVIGINCKYRVDMLSDDLNFTLYHLHNDKDPIVDYEPALESFNAMKKIMKKEAHHISLDSKTHEITQEIISTLKTLL